MISTINKFSLEQHKGLYEQWPRQTKLLINEEYTGTQLAGYIIEAQFAVHDHYLIILSMDCMYEESNTIYLLNSKYTIVASVNIPEGFSHFPDSYLLDECKIVGDSEILLQYNHNLFFKLQINLNAKIFFSKKLRCSPLKITNDYRRP